MESGDPERSTLARSAFTSVRTVPIPSKESINQSQQRSNAVISLNRTMGMLSPSQTRIGSISDDGHSCGDAHQGRIGGQAPCTTN